MSHHRDEELLMTTEEPKRCFACKIAREGQYGAGEAYILGLTDAVRMLVRSDFAPPSMTGGFCQPHADAFNARMAFPISEEPTLEELRRAAPTIVAAHRAQLAHDFPIPPLPPRPRSRADHFAVDKAGACSRCGLSPRVAAACPSGFWMTAEERKAWDAAAPLERAELEKRFLWGKKR